LEVWPGFWNRCRDFGKSGPKKISEKSAEKSAKNQRADFSKFTKKSRAGQNSPPKNLEFQKNQKFSEFPKQVSRFTCFCLN